MPEFKDGFQNSLKSLCHCQKCKISRNTKKDKNNGNGKTKI